jgi:hypothetical protein
MNTIKRFTSDVDIDLGDRTQALRLLEHTPASILRDGQLVRHNTGIYVTDIPQDPFTGQASLDYESAEERGYMKLDFLNVSLYTQIKSEQHLIELMNQEPEWDRLYNPEFCGRLIHIGNHYKTLIQMPEAVNSDVRLMMFMAVIRPAKRHLIGLPWREVAKTIWDRAEDGTYGYKKSHAAAYSKLVVVHMNLLVNAGL